MGFGCEFVVVWVFGSGFSESMSASAAFRNPSDDPKVTLNAFRALRRVRS
jgi:hypothetical protein